MSLSFFALFGVLRRPSRFFDRFVFRCTRDAMGIHGMQWKTLDSDGHILCR